MKNIIHIYTDASFSENKERCGHSIILLRDDKTHNIGMTYTKDYLVKKELTIKPTISVCEAYAIYDTLCLFKNELFVEKDKVVRIYSDAMNVLEKLNYLLGKRKNKKINKRLNKNKIFNLIFEKINSLKENKNIDVELFWVRSHNKCYGNVQADLIANRMRTMKIKDIQDKYFFEKIGKSTLINELI